MKAWRSGDVPGIDGLALDEIARPVPGPGELLVRVEAAAVNFSDLLMIGDRYQVRPERPFTPGQEVAGVVEESGPGAAVRPGERIASKTIFGGFAEKAVVRDGMAIRLPDTVGFAEGAALPVVYTTAVVALTETASVGEGDSVLIFAATGGMGIASIQVAKALGARAIAVASGAAKEAVARGGRRRHRHPLRGGRFRRPRDGGDRRAGGRGRGRYRRRRGDGACAGLPRLARRAPGRRVPERRGAQDPGPIACCSRGRPRKASTGTTSATARWSNAPSGGCWKWSGTARSGRASIRATASPTCRAP